MKLRISRKLLLLIGGVFIVTATSGAAAVYIGADRLMGPSYKDKNGLVCTEAATVTIKKKDRLWVRKFIKTEAADGPTRVKTALRVARAVYEKDHDHRPDLVQIIVLDKNGPSGRSDMRGRAVGADVIFVPEPAKVPDAGQSQPYVARYIDKAPTASGEFFGEKTFMTDGDIAALLATLDDKTDCLPLPGAAGEVAGGHGAKPDGKSEGKGEAKKGGGHGAPAAEEAKQEAEAPAEDAEGETKPESKGWFASIKEMIFGAEQAAPKTPDGEPSAEKKAAADAIADKLDAAEAKPVEGGQQAAKH